MFIDFFYKLKEVGIPVSPTSFLTLQKALGSGLVNSLEDFYTASRTVLVKSERYFDLFDQVFAHHFKGAEMPDKEGVELDEMVRVMLEAWLQNPEDMSKLLGVDESALNKLTPEQLIEYLKSASKIRMGNTTGAGNGLAPGDIRRWAIPDITRAVCALAGCRRVNRLLRWPWTGAIKIIL